jgi:glycogen(starch) synthase
LFTAGRYEFRNKGVDMFIESLARESSLLSHFPLPGPGTRGRDAYLYPGLNHRLKEAGSKTTVVAFIIMPAATNSYTIEALKGQAVTAALKETVNQVTQRVGRRIFEHALRYSGYVSFSLHHLACPLSHLLYAATHPTLSRLCDPLPGVAR